MSFPKTKIVFAALLFSICFDANAQSFVQDEINAAGILAPSTDTQFSQITMELALPGISQNVRMTASDLVTMQFVTILLSNPSAAKNDAVWSVLPSFMFGQNGSLQLRAKVTHGDEKTTKSILAQKSLPIAEAAKGIPAGDATIKLIQKNAPNELPLIQNVWLLVVSRNGTTNPEVKNLPATLLSQTTAALGFRPAIVYAQIIFKPANISGQTMLNSATQHIGLVLNKETLEIKTGCTIQPKNQSIFSGPFESLTDNNIMRKNILGGGYGWVGAPIFIGPVQSGSDETYVVLVAEGKSPAAAK